MEETIKTFLTHLHRGGEWGYYWQAASIAPVWFRAGNPTQSPTSGNVYFSVHPGRERLSGNARGGLENVAAINCLFSEYDCKDYGSYEAIVDHLQNLLIAPSVTIRSGGGVHCYWLLHETVIVNGNLEALKDAQARWVEFTGGDKGAKDLARVLRLPGSLNHKYDPPREVAFVTVDFDMTFTLDVLVSILPEKPAEEPRPVAPPPRIYQVIGGTDDYLRPIDAYLVGQTFSQVLTPHGWKLMYTRGEVEYWQRPGKDGDGISATVGHAGHDILYVFSSNASPFEPETGYSLATAFVLLNYGGDFKAAAQALKPKRPAPQPAPASSWPASAPAQSPQPNGADTDTSPLPIQKPVRELNEAMVRNRLAIHQVPGFMEYLKERGVKLSTALLYGLGYGLPWPDVSNETFEAAKTAKLIWRGGWGWAGGVVHADPIISPEVVTVRYIPDPLLPPGERGFTIQGDHRTWGSHTTPLGSWRVRPKATQIIVITPELFSMLLVAQKLEESRLYPQIAVVYTNGEIPSRKMLEWFKNTTASYVLIPPPGDAGDSWRKLVTGAIKRGHGSHYRAMKPPDNLPPDQALLHGWWPAGL